MSPSTLPPPVVRVEYDGANGERKLSKVFKDPYEARRFYGKLLRDGKNPRVKKGQE